VAIGAMATKFTDLVCWQLADELRRLVLEITAQSHVTRDFRYCDQSKDAARSAASNIAEGFGRFRHRDFANFLHYAIGSLSEVQDLLIDGHERGYVSDTQLANGKRLVVRSKSACVALKAYLLRTPVPKQ
jgi:four helix bundle protein